MPARVDVAADEPTREGEGAGRLPVGREPLNGRKEWHSFPSISAFASISVARYSDTLHEMESCPRGGGGWRAAPTRDREGGIMLQRLQQPRQATGGASRDFTTREKEESNADLQWSSGLHDGG